MKSGALILLSAFVAFSGPTRADAQSTQELKRMSLEDLLNIE